MPARSVIAARPAPPTQNPARSSSMNPRLINTLVRLEAPVELPGRWDGPVYVRLGREAKHLPQGDTSEFSKDDDASRRPGWYCKIVSLWPGQLPSAIDPDRRAILEDGEDHWIPFWRLTQPNVNLHDEDPERPLLSVFRFVRVSSYYLAAPRDDQRLIHVTSDVHVCGQVLAYSRIGVLTGSVGIQREPGSTYMCHVAIRRLATAPSRVVAIPLDEVRAALISREEFVLGYYDGVPASVPVPAFATPWASVLAAPGATTTATALYRSLTMTFADADAPHGSTVSITSRDPIALVLPSGERTSVQPLECIQDTVIIPASAQGVDEAMDGDESPAPMLPLLTRAEIAISEWDPIPSPSLAVPQGQAHLLPTHPQQTGLQFFVPLSGQARLTPATTMSPAQPPATTTTIDTPTHVGAVPGADAHVASAPSTAVPLASDPAVHALLQEQARQFTQLQAQFQAAMQAQLQAQLQAQAQAQKAELQATIAAITQRATTPGDGAHRGRSASSRKDRSRSTGHLRAQDAHRHSLAVHARDHHAQLLTHSLLKVAVGTVRALGLRRTTGTVVAALAVVTVSAAPVVVTAIAHVTGTPGVSPRQAKTASASRRTKSSSTPSRPSVLATRPAQQDRIASMLQTELFRGQYPASKITTKMVFTVDYFSRPLDYFLASDAQPARHRAVLHDDTQWGGREPPPANTISRADDLHRVLHSISDVAISWYTDRVATVFRTVHGHAVQHVRRDAPGAVLGAFINLYTKIFQNLFFDLVNDIHVNAVAGRALAALRDDSPEYRSIVHRVLHDTMMTRVFQHHSTSGSNSGRPRQRERTQDRRQPQGPTTTVIPQVIRNGIPEVTVRSPDGTPMTKDGKLVQKAVCLRFQAHDGCSFRSCKHVHELHKLPDDVLAWLKSHHGALKSQHPQNDISNEILASKPVSPLTYDVSNSPHHSSAQSDCLASLPVRRVGPILAHPPRLISTPPVECLALAGVPHLTTSPSPLAHCLLPDPLPTPCRAPVIVSFDGGSRSGTNRSAYGWCVWSSDHRLLQWGAELFAPAHTNNAMEAQGLLSCLAWCRHQRITHITAHGDSAVIINHALQLGVCRAPHLQHLIGRIRAYGAIPARIRLLHVRRELNGAADALCNWVMDTVPAPSYRSSTAWPCPITYAPPMPPSRSEPPLPPPFDSDQVFHASLWHLVMLDLRAVGDLIANRFTANFHPQPVQSARPIGPAPPTIVTVARRQPSVFDASTGCGCWVAGRHRYVPHAIFTAMNRLAVQHGIPFPIETSFVSTSALPGTVPRTDLAILDAFVQLPGLGIAGTLELYRGQTARDYRPNKALHPTWYRQHLPSYPELELLCTIAQEGLTPHWICPAKRVGPRPIPANYIGAEQGAQVVVGKLLADFFLGRCIVASVTTLSRDPGFHSSAFALVPKHDIPLTLDGRTIHDLSSPVGQSVNDLTDSTASPDATWDPPPSIAARVRDLHRRYPGYNVYAMGADIADAFHHVPVHARHASAFGGKLPLSDIGIVSGMAVFGWTASPGFFAVFGKASRHYQRTGASIVLGSSEPFWIYQWVDDIVLVEVDIGDRLQQAEKRLRDGVKLVFGPHGWHEGKFTTWSRQFHAVGIDWNIDAETISIPQRKIDKVTGIISDTLTLRFVSTKRLDSLVGVLRHIITFIPVTKPFIQRLTATQMNCRRRHGTGVSMTQFLRKDLEWWKALTFQNEFSGMPMRLFEPRSAIDDCWTVEYTDTATRITSMLLEQRVTFEYAATTRREAVAVAIERATSTWGPALQIADAWRHVVIYSHTRWALSVITRMNSDTERGQALLHEQRKESVRLATQQLKQAAIAESTLGMYSRNFKYWEKFCSDFGFPVWIDELPRAQQARMVGLYAGLCSSEGHNKSKTGNKFQTFDGKMAAVIFAHKAVRNAKLNYRDPEFELVAQGYKRTNSQVERKQPVTASMLLKMRERMVRPSREERLRWGSIVLGFFFLDRSSELWGPVTHDKSTGTERAHCVKAHNVILRDQYGQHVQPEDSRPHSVEIVFESHKGDRIGQGVTIRHYRSEQQSLCPVEAAQECLRIRSQWIQEGRKLGPYLTSTSTSKTIKKATVAAMIKDAATAMGLAPKDYSPHSLRIGGACALLAAGKSDLVIRLMGRWSSWCFSVYTRLRPGMLRDAASCMIKASIWERHEPGLPTQGGIAIEAHRS